MLNYSSKENRKETDMPETNDQYVYIPATVKEIGKAISSALENEDNELAWNRFIQLSDNLVGCKFHYLTQVTQDAPVTGSHEWDLALAALVEYRLNIRNSPLPIWVKEKVGSPKKPWIPHPNKYEIKIDIAEVPQEFLLRGILVEESTLQSV